MKPKIFSEITGKTHGIKFKMNPPMKPKRRNVRIPREGCTSDGVVAAAICGAVSCHALRSLPFGNFEKTIRPGIAERFLSGDSVGILKVTSFPLRDSTAG